MNKTSASSIESAVAQLARRSSSGVRFNFACRVRFAPIPGEHPVVSSISRSVGFRRQSVRETVQNLRAPAPEASARTVQSERVRPL